MDSFLAFNNQTGNVVKNSFYELQVLIQIVIQTFITPQLVNCKSLHIFVTYRYQNL